MDKPNAAENSAGVKEVQGFMGAVKMAFVQPGIHSLPQFAGVHRLVMIVKAFPLERTNKPLHEGLFLGGFGPCPVNAKGDKTAPRVLHVPAAVDGFHGFPETGGRFLPHSCGVPA
jgi:hypothetical protein